MAIVEREVEFQSEGVTCRGLFVRPEGVANAPLLVLAHGLGGVYEMCLDRYARRFAEAGYACLTFDYRYFGRSDGLPRHLLEKDEQQRDIEAAISFGKTLPGVDGARLGLWGTSLAGGHMMDVTARRSDVAATIVQAPFSDGPASLGATSPISTLGVAGFFVADLLARMTGQGRVLVPLAAPPHVPALMTKPDVVESVLALMPDGSRFSGKLSALYRLFAQRSVKLGENVSLSQQPDPYPVKGFVGSVVFPSGTALLNGVTANFALEIVSWRPGKQLAKTRSPVLVCVCEHDSVAPAKQTIAHAKRGPSTELKVYPHGHFDIYRGAPWEQVMRDQLAFLARVLPVQRTERTLTATA